MLAACPAEPQQQAQRGTVTGAAQLQRRGETLSLLQDGVVVRSCVAGTVQPYRIVSTGAPIVVTAADGDLRVATWAVPANGDPVRHVDLLPSISQPPLTALIPLTESPSGIAEGLSLLAGDGTVSWTDPRADLLWAFAGADPAVAYAAVASGDDLIYVYGETPQLTAVDAATGRELWRRGLQPLGPAVDIQLWGLSADHGLLLLQYDYEVFEFVSFARSTGDLLQRHRLDGQPAIRLVYPGPTWEPARVKVTGGSVSLAVNDVEQGYQLWTFDLADGTLDKAALPGFAVTAREENALELAGGSTSGAAPMPQGLLPTETGDNWTIPALLNADGRVLVVDSEGAAWR
jgi:outer membrane protein assembly factor BamB